MSEQKVCVFVGVCVCVHPQYDNERVGRVLQFLSYLSTLCRTVLCCTVLEREGGELCCDELWCFEERGGEGRNNTLFVLARLQIMMIHLFAMQKQPPKKHKIYVLLNATDSTVQ